MLVVGDVSTTQQPGWLYRERAAKSNGVLPLKNFHLDIDDDANLRYDVRNSCQRTCDKEIFACTTHRTVSVASHLFILDRERYLHYP
jgi:hypothetical protein